MRKNVLILFAFLPFWGFGQEVIKGKITDSKSGESLPFVHIISAKAKAVSDIEGNYTLRVPRNTNLADSIEFSVIGYAKKKITFSDLAESPKVKMEKSALDLAVFTVVAKEDPAYAMIRKAVKMRKQNDPEQLPKFRYHSYNKAYLDMDRSDEQIKREIDSSNFANAHFMMLESATEVTFEQPNKVKERVLANQISGFSNPLFSLQSNSFQPFSSYSAYLKFIDFDFLNPISPNSDGRYLFQLEDSVETAEGKAYVIAFQPRKNANGNLLEGSITLDANEWAIVTIQAKNSGEHNLASFEIRQQYQKVNGHWFPEQSSSRYIFTESEPPIWVISNTYIDSVEYEFDPGRFGIANVEITKDANNQTAESWKPYRQVDLTDEESNTYKVYDTLDTRILKAFDWTMSQSASLARGRFSIGKADILLPHILGFNQYEGLRLGIGLSTNDKLIKWMSPEAYFAYGFRDKEMKYGGGLRFRIQPKREFEFYVGYENDVDEPGRSSTENMGGFLKLGEVERDLFIRFMNPYEAYKAELKYRPMRDVRTTLSIRNERRNFERTNRTDASFEEYNLTTTEVGILVEYNPGEALMMVGSTLVPQGVSYPRISLEVNQAINELFESEQEYTKAELRVMHEINVARLGALRLFATGGKIWADQINQSNLILSRGISGERDLGIVGFGYFHTMPLYSFINDQYAQAGISQNFGNPFGMEWVFSRPEIRLMYQAAIGNLETPSTFVPDMPQVTMDRAYLEGGIVIDNILRYKGGSLYYSGLGIGVFYRHGYYELPSFGDNLAYAVSFAISF
ncbi:DUF5686 family protein [Cryomorphaceae bacterium 1068]|nr:DUF5686 family protein [Cryomorphaceae bacterium 1068]